MGYTDVDKLAINTIRLLAVISLLPADSLPLHLPRNAFLPQLSPPQPYSSLLANGS